VIIFDITNYLIIFFRVGFARPGGAVLSSYREILGEPERRQRDRSSSPPWRSPEVAKFLHSCTRVGIELPQDLGCRQKSSKEEYLRGGLPRSKTEIRKEFLQGESPYISASRSPALVPDLEGSW